MLISYCACEYTNLFIDEGLNYDLNHRLNEAKSIMQFKDLYFQIESLSLVHHQCKQKQFRILLFVCSFPWK